MSRRRALYFLVVATGFATCLIGGSFYDSGQTANVQRYQPEEGDGADSASGTVSIPHGRNNVILSYTLIVNGNLPEGYDPVVFDYEISISGGLYDSGQQTVSLATIDSSWTETAPNVYQKTVTTTISVTTLCQNQDVSVTIAANATKVPWYSYGGNFSLGGTFQYAAPATLIQFGWASTNRQQLYRTSTFGDNGTTLTGTSTDSSLVWVDPLGNSNPTVNDPAAFVGGYSSALQNVVLQIDSTASTTATIQVTVDPGDFSFGTAQASFVNGQATVSSISMSNNFPDIIHSGWYTFNWSIQFSGGDFQEFQTTYPSIYLMHSTFTNSSDAYQATTTRMAYVVAIADGAAADTGLTTIESALANQVQYSPGLDAGYHVADPNNVWAALDGLPAGEDGLDCESVAAITAAQLQQLGYVTANVGRAYPTGAVPSGDTDATTQESETVSGVVYSLSFANGNYFEGFLVLDSPDVDSPTTFTVFPISNGPLNSTGCTVSPTTNANLLAFRVLTSTYLILTVPYQEWYWDVNQNSPPAPDPPNFGQISLPLNNCPSNEVPQ